MTPKTCRSCFGSTKRGAPCRSAGRRHTSVAAGELISVTTVVPRTVVEVGDQLPAAESLGTSTPGVVNAYADWSLRHNPPAMTPVVTDNRAQEPSNSSPKGGIGPLSTWSGEDEQQAAERIAGPFRLEVARINDREAIEGAIVLGDRATDTLGHLPFEAYDDAASRNGLVVALDRHRRVVGYALFGLTPRFVRLAHLAVDVEARRQGLGRALVDRIAADHSERQGILAWCRHDYGLGAMWSALGFERRGEKRGRGAKATTLVGWWRDLGQPQLFQPRSADTIPHELAVHASLDFNVIRDLAGERRRDEKESLALLSDQFVGRLELVTTPVLDLEIDELGDPTVRRSCADRALTLSKRRPPQAEVATVQEHLLAAIAATNPAFMGSLQGQRDIRYVAEAVAAGLNVLITRDQDLRDALHETAAAAGLRILRPSEVVVWLDELARADAYRTRSFLATSYSTRLLRAGEESRIEPLVARRAGEKESEFKARIRELSAAGYERLVVLDDRNSVAAAVVSKRDRQLLDVQVLRVADGPLAPTLVRQLLFALRVDALVPRTKVLQVSDPYLSSTVVAGLDEDGYVTADAGRVAYVVDVCGPARLVSDAISEAAQEAGLAAPPRLATAVPAVVAGNIERAWWPVKVTDSQLPTYVISIRQEFSRELLGVPEGLFARDRDLGLSREQVYFRSPIGLGMTAPARLLWYMSGSGGRGFAPAGIVGGSILEEVIDDEPRWLHERLRHLGVWDLGQIEAVSKEGTAQALRFSRTYKFQNPISARIVRRELGRYPQGPMGIDAAAFAQLYSMGRGNA